MVWCLIEQRDKFNTVICTNTSSDIMGLEVNYFLGIVSTGADLLHSIVFRLFLVFFNFLKRGGVRLSPFGTSTTKCPIVPAPDDR
jgi:hypothetical protein